MTKAVTETVQGVNITLQETLLKEEDRSKSLQPQTATTSRKRLEVPAGGLKQTISHRNRSTHIGNLTITSRENMSPGQLEEWTDAYAN